MRPAWVVPVTTGVASAALFASSLWAPPLGFILCLASPLPVALAARDGGARGAGTALATAVCLLALVAGPLGATVYAAQFGAGGCLLGLAVRASRPPQTAIGLYAGAATVAFWGSLGVLAFAEGMGVGEYYSSALAHSLEQATGLLLQGQTDPEALANVQEWAADTQRLLDASFPGIMGAMAILTGWLNALALRRLGRAPTEEPWDHWRAPESWIWVLIGSGLAGFLAPGAVGRIGLNVFIPAAAVYFLQGIAVIQHLFATKGLPRMVRALAYTLLFLQLPVMLLVAGVGAFDLWFNFRSRWTPRPPLEDH